MQITLTRKITILIVSDVLLYKLLFYQNNKYSTSTDQHGQYLTNELNGYEVN